MPVGFWIDVGLVAFACSDGEIISDGIINVIDSFIDKTFWNHSMFSRGTFHVLVVGNGSGTYQPQAVSNRTLRT